MTDLELVEHYGSNGYTPSEVMRMGNRYARTAKIVSDPAFAKEYDMRANAHWSAAQMMQAKLDKSNKL